MIDKDSAVRVGFVWKDPFGAGLLSIDLLIFVTSTQI